MDISTVLSMKLIDVHLIDPYGVERAKGYWTQDLVESATIWEVEHPMVRLQLRRRIPVKLCLYPALQHLISHLTVQLLLI